jgi:protein O-mannosyl-transferase
MKETRNQILFPIRKMKNHKIILSLCLILALPSISLFPSLKNDFVNWDDPQYVTENKMITELSWRNIETIFDSTTMGHYHPLTLLSYSLEYRFFKLNPFVYHLTNLILHLLNGLLVFCLVWMLKGGVLISLVVSLLFGIHPLHVESVAWISERKDLLYSFFFLGSLIVYLAYLKTWGKRFYVLSLFLFLLSLLSKSMAVTLPLVLLLCDHLLHRKIDRKCLIEKIPFLAIAFIFGIMALFAQGSPEIMSQKTSFPFSKNTFIMSEVLTTYFSKLLLMSEVLTSYFPKLILPIKLSCLYPPIKGIAGPWSYVYLPIVIAILIAGIILGRYNKNITFGTLFFFITIIPTLPAKIMADRYIYIPSIGLFFIAAEGFYWLYRSKLEPIKIVKPILAILLIGILGTFSFLTWERCQVWKDSMSLWNNVLKNYPEIPIAYNNLGEVYLRKGDYERAISNYNQALRMNPDFRGANYFYVNRGTAYLMKGDYEMAIADYHQALRIKPNDANAYHHRGTAYLNKGDFEGAISDFNKALEINPGNAETYFYKALACEKIGRLQEALESYKGFMENVPPQYSNYINYAKKKIRELSK